ncbi:MAG: hypothetical protein M1383_03225 [Patescibacteria group bacterium]|nr:hypothetical protein [Patescibacteria group bacterium]
MDHKEAANILIKLAEKESLIPQEKQAVLIAVGVLSWTSLAQNRVREMRKKGKRTAKGRLRG